MHKTIRVALLLIGVVVIASYVIRQRNLAMGGAGAYCSLCAVDPHAPLVALHGIVTDVHVPDKGNAQEIVYFTLNSGKSSMVVRTAPGEYLQAIGLTIQTGSSVKLDGWQLTADGKPYVVARALTFGSHLYLLRTPSGKPNYWDQVIQSFKAK